MNETQDMSPTIGTLAAALAAAQGKITGALKDSKNPFFKSTYADLASCWEACRGPLSENKLAVIQTTEVDEQGVTVVTTLAHGSGEWLRGKLRMMPKDTTPQAFGSAITYARRYALTAIVGIAQVDDDGNAASGKETGKANVHDPKGEAYKNADPVKRDEYVKNLLDALNADAEEEDIGGALYAIRAELIKDAEMFNAVWDKIPAKERRAIKEYIDMARKAAEGVRAA